MDSDFSTAGLPGRKRPSGRTEPPAATGRALIAVTPKLSRSWFAFAGLKPSHGAVAAAVAGVMGLGFVGGTAIFADKPHAAVAVLAQASPTADPQIDMLRSVQGEVQLLRASLDGLKAAADPRQTEESVRALKRSVDALKSDLETAKASSAGAVNQLSAKIDKLDHDPGPKLAEIAARLDKVAELTTRVDRIEHQVSSASPTGSIAAPASLPAAAAKPAPAIFVPSPTGPLPPARIEAKTELKAEPKPEQVARVEPPIVKPEAPAKPATVDGWLLRDVYGGVALVEGRAGLREVAPGEYVPGVGEIRSIERRGRSWVVVTSRGLIQADNRW